MPFFRTAKSGDQCKKEYTLGKTLGTGSFATVKLATHKADKSKWAVKIINRKNMEQEDADALQTEVEILQKVSHKNIIELKEVFDEKDHFYMVQELCAGGELFDRIVEKEKYSEGEAAKAVLKVASALAYCHAQDIVHRDLKPENLLLTSAEDDAEIKIADFGLAKLLNTDSLMQTACGTPGYVAPEILEVRAYDNKVDTWSLGVITYILLCGFPPFYDDNNAKLFETIKAGAFDFPSPYWDDISQNAKDAINMMLTVNPEERVSCEDLQAHAWFKEAGALTAEINKESLVQFNAKRKFKAAIAKVKLVNKLGGMK